VVGGARGPRLGQPNIAAKGPRKRGITSESASVHHHANAYAYVAELPGDKKNPFVHDIQSTPYSVVCTPYAPYCSTLLGASQFIPCPNSIQCEMSNWFIKLQSPIIM
jgi:hypothetical protein